MHRLLFTGLDAAIAGLIMVPVFWLMNKKYIHNHLCSIYYFLFAVYLSAVFSVVGLPDICYVRFDPHINLDLFAYMFSDAKSSFLNVILFLPMGFFLPSLWRDVFPLGKTMLFGLTASAFIELLQIFTFRATDVNDLITNTFGTLLGWYVFRLIQKTTASKQPAGNPRDVFYICSFVFLVMFFIHPYAAYFIHLIFF